MALCHMGSRHTWTFPPVKAQVKFLLVGIDHFTKWIEVELVATILAANVHKFLWKNIVYHFRIPNTLISDNGKLVIDKVVEEFLTNLGIKHRSN